MRYLLARKIFYYLIGAVLIYGLGFILVPVMISRLGLLEFGIYSTLAIFSISGYIALFEFGMQTSTVKYVAQYFQENDFAEINKILNTVMVIYLGLGALVAVVGYFSAAWLAVVFSIPEAYHAEFIFSLKLTFFTFLFSFPSLGFASVLKGLQKFVVFKNIEVVVSVLRTAGIILLLFLGYRIKELVLFSVVLQALQLLIFGVYTLKTVDFLKLNLKYFSLPALLRLLPLGRLVFVGQLSSFAFQHADRIMISLIMGPQALAAYEVVMRIPSALKSFNGQINALLVSISSHLEGGRDSKDSLKNVFVKTIRYQIIFTFPALFAVALFSKEVLLIWLGPEFTGLYLILTLALLWNVMSPYFNVGSSLLLGLNRKVRELITLSVISAVVNLVLNLVLIHYFGLVGIVAATLIALLVVLPKNLKIFSDVLGFPKLVLVRDLGMICLIGSLCAGVYKIFIYFYPMDIKTIGQFLPVLAVWFGLFYFLIFKWLLDSADRDILFNLLSKKGAEAK